VLRISRQVGAAVESFGAWLSPSESIDQLLHSINMIMQPIMTQDVVWALQVRPVAADMHGHELNLTLGRLTTACFTLEEHFQRLQLRSLTPVGPTAAAQSAHEKLLIAMRVVERAMDKVS
jgi:hypothetical protein